MQWKWTTAAMLLVAAIPAWTHADDEKPAGYSIAWTSADCRSCHRVDEAVFSHPTGIAPSMLLPAGLPLEYGQLACTTCHMNTSSDHAISRDAGDGMLRPLAARCDSCHTDAPASSRIAHGMVVGRAHDGLSTDARFGGGVARPRAAFNADTSCLSCHDGSGAKSLGVSHPSAVPYRRTRTGSGISSLVPAVQLDQRVRLFDGNVTCNSCHSPYSSQPRFLVMANDRGQLCSSCHDMH